MTTSTTYFKNNFNVVTPGQDVFNGDIPDDVLSYNNYYIEISSTTNCNITVYQSNDTITPSVSTTYLYVVGNTTSISNKIIGKYIKFSVIPISNGILNFSVAYKASGSGSTGVGPTGATGATGTVLFGKVARVDSVNGNDTTGAIGSNPFATVQGAIASITGAGDTGNTIWVLPGTYTLPMTGIIIPSYTALRGLNTQTCILNLGATGNTTMITMGENCRVEDLTMNLTSTDHYDLIGMGFTGTSSVTSKLRTSVLSVNNSSASATGTSNIYGVLSSGTGTLGSASFSFNSLKGSTINVYSNGGGKKRGLYVTTSNIVTTRDLNIYVAPPTDVSSLGSYVGCEVNDTGNTGASGGSVQFRSTTLGTKAPSYVSTGTIQSYTSSDILQTTPSSIENPTYLASAGIQIGPGTDLVTKTAGSKGLSTYIYPTTIYYGLKGNVSSSGTSGWLWPGTQAVSAGVFPDPSGTPASIILNVTGCTSGTNQITVNDTTGLGLSIGMPIVFSSNYGYIQQGAVIGTPAVNPYYIKSIPDATHITIGTYNPILTEFNPGTYSNSTTTAMVYTKTVNVTNITNGNNHIVISGTTGLLIGMPIIFQLSINSVPPITAGTIYYIKTVDNNGSQNYITISQTYNGNEIDFTGSASGFPYTANVVTISSAPAYYRIQQPSILSGMAGFLSVGSGNTGATGLTVSVYRTPVGSDYQFGVIPVAGYSLNFTGTTQSASYYNSSQNFAAGDRIHAYLAYTGVSTAHDFTLQLDMF